MAKNYIHMGSFLRAHGISGEIVLDWYAVSPFSSSLPFFLDCNGTLTPLTITGARRHNGRLLVRVQGIEDRTSAEGLRGKELFVARSALPEPKDNEAYINDLFGAEVFLEDGTLLGTFENTLAGGGNEIWLIRANNGKEILFPAIPAFIAKLDTAHQRIVIAPPEGLISLYLEDDNQAESKV